MSSAPRSAIIGSGKLRTAEQSGKMATLGGMDEFVDQLTLQGFKTLDGIALTRNWLCSRKKVRDSITKNSELFEVTKRPQIAAAPNKQ